MGFWKWLYDSPRNTDWGVWRMLGMILSGGLAISLGIVGGWDMGHPFIPWHIRIILIALGLLWILYFFYLDGET